MAILKYADGIDPLRKEHYGYTFIRSNYGRSVMQGQRNDRKRYSAQWQRVFNLIECTRSWRHLSAGVKNAWSVFAATYPQPTKRDPDKYLTGYQLFVKRNYYQFLHEGPSASFITEPELTVLNDPEFSIMINADGQCIDITELYIARFGILPDAGQFVIVRIVPISQVGGAFFPPLVATVEVDQVYIDGLFLSFFFTSYFEEVEFSIYVSKPVWESVQYPGTKFRYMGCFKPTKFIQLTDTPDSYVGEGGKVVAVKDDETGVEFIEAGGGGIDCDDLAGCSLIQQIIAQLTAVSELVSVDQNVSVPPVHFGLIYNWTAFNSGLMASGGGWRVPVYASDVFPWNAALGGFASLSPKIKEASIDYWTSIAGVTNFYNFYFRGGGIRNNDGSFSNLKVEGRFWLDAIGTSSVFGIAFHNVIAFSTGSAPKSITKLGHSIRLCRAATGQPDGLVGSYVGNDGRVYRTITLNGLEWLTDNLAETKFNDGSEIPEVTNAASWAALSSPGMCAYNNDWANV
jgi:hypothetical protein